MPAIPDESDGDGGRLDVILILGRTEEGQIGCTLYDPLPEHPAELGVLLADLIRHYGLAYQSKGRERAQTIMEIWSVLQAEMSNPTDEIKVLQNFEGAVPPGGS